MICSNFKVFKAFFSRFCPMPGQAQIESGATFVLGWLAPDWAAWHPDD